MVGPSKLSKVSVCPARYPFTHTSPKNSGQGREVNKFAERGTRLHKLAEDWIGRVKQRGLLHDPATWTGLMTDKERNGIIRAAKTLVRHLLKLKKRGLIVSDLHSEFGGKHVHEESGIGIYYEVDAIFQLENSSTGESHCTVVDWKSTLSKAHASPDSEYSTQVRIYSLLLSLDGMKVDEGMLISLEKQAAYKQKVMVDLSPGISLDRILSEWQGQETRPSMSSCGHHCPRFSDKQNPCPDAELPSFDQIPLDRSRTAFRESSLDCQTWLTLVADGVVELPSRRMKLLKSRKTKIFVDPGNHNGCDVRGIAIARSRPEGVVEIEVEPRVLITSPQ